MIDSHCHLADEAFADDLEAVIDRARGAGLQTVLCILAAGNARESEAASRLRAEWPDVHFSCGVHPHHAHAFLGQVSAAVETVQQSIAAEGACAIGEIGLDYHYDFSPRSVQQEVFRAQVVLARDLRLPIVIHTREATEDTFQILRETGNGEVRGVFHCFTGDSAMARVVLDLGFYISLSGIVTFPRAQELRDIAGVIPPDRLLVETDAPYLAPVPHRGERNEPAYVMRVLAEVAVARGVTTETLAALVCRNFHTFLGPNVSHQTA